MAISTCLNGSNSVNGVNGVNGQNGTNGGYHRKTRVVVVGLGMVALCKSASGHEESRLTQTSIYVCAT